MSSNEAKNPSGVATECLSPTQEQGLQLTKGRVAFEMTPLGETYPTAPPEKNTLMQCGDVAHAVCHTAHFGLESDHPTCVIHAVSRAACTPNLIAPNLEGRQARCAYGCGQRESSSLDLAFFEYRGEGSPESYRGCKNCGYYETAHTPDVKNKNVCKNFTPKGAQEFDSYYCGCRGWD